MNALIASHRRAAELNDLRQKIAKLEAARDQDLRSAPALFGYKTAADFVKEIGRVNQLDVRVHGSASSPRVEPAASAQAALAASQSAAPKKKRTRAVITDATRAQVKKLVNQNRTAGEIAKAVGISMPSVQNIKKALGLVKAR